MDQDAGDLSITLGALLGSAIILTVPTVVALRRTRQKFSQKGQKQGELVAQTPERRMVKCSSESAMNCTPSPRATTITSPASPDEVVLDLDQFAQRVSFSPTRPCKEKNCERSTYDLDKVDDETSIVVLAVLEEQKNRKRRHSLGAATPSTEPSNPQVGANTLDSLDVVMSQLSGDKTKGSTCLSRVTPCMNNLASSKERDIEMGMHPEHIPTYTNHMSEHIQFFPKFSITMCKNLISVLCPFISSNLYSSLSECAVVALISLYAGTEHLAAYAVVCSITTLTVTSVVSTINTATIGLVLRHPKLANEHVWFGMLMGQVYCIPMLLMWSFVTVYLARVLGLDPAIATLAQEFAQTSCISFWAYYCRELLLGYLELYCDTEFVAHVEGFAIMSKVTATVLSILIMGYGIPGLGWAFSIAEGILLSAVCVRAIQKRLFFVSSVSLLHLIKTSTARIEYLRRHGFFNILINSVLQSSTWHGLTIIAILLGHDCLAAWIILEAVWNLVHSLLNPVVETSIPYLVMYSSRRNNKNLTIIILRLLTCTTLVGVAIAGAIVPIGNFISIFTYDESVSQMIDASLPLLTFSVIGFGICLDTLTVFQCQKDISSRYGTIVCFNLVYAVACLTCALTTTLVFDRGLAGLVFSHGVGIMTCAFACLSEMFSQEWWFVNTKDFKTKEMSEAYQYEQIQHKPFNSEMASEKQFLTSKPPSTSTPLRKSTKSNERNTTSSHMTDAQSTIASVEPASEFFTPEKQPNNLNLLKKSKIVGLSFACIQANKKLHNALQDRDSVGSGSSKNREEVELVLIDTHSSTCDDASQSISSSQSPPNIKEARIDCDESVYQDSATNPDAGLVVAESKNDANYSNEHENVKQADNQDYDFEGHTEEEFIQEQNHEDLTQVQKIQEQIEEYDIQNQNDVHGPSDEEDDESIPDDNRKEDFTSYSENNANLPKRDGSQAIEEHSQTSASDLASRQSGKSKKWKMSEKMTHISSYIDHFDEDEAVEIERHLSNHDKEQDEDDIRSKTSSPKFVSVQAEDSGSEPELESKENRWNISEKVTTISNYIDLVEVDENLTPSINDSNGHVSDNLTPMENAEQSWSVKTKLQLYDRRIETSSMNSFLAGEDLVSVKSDVRSKVSSKDLENSEQPPPPPPPPRHKTTKPSNSVAPKITVSYDDNQVELQKQNSFFSDCVSSLGASSVNEAIDRASQSKGVKNSLPAISVVNHDQKQASFDSDEVSGISNRELESLPSMDESAFIAFQARDNPHKSAKYTLNKSMLMPGRRGQVADLSSQMSRKGPLKSDQAVRNLREMGSLPVEDNSVISETQSQLRRQHSLSSMPLPPLKEEYGDYSEFTEDVRALRSMGSHPLSESVSGSEDSVNPTHVDVIKSICSFPLSDSELGEKIIKVKASVGDSASDDGSIAPSLVEVLSLPLVHSGSNESSRRIPKQEYLYAKDYEYEPHKVITDSNHTRTNSKRTKSQVIQSIYLDEVELHALSVASSVSSKIFKNESRRACSTASVESIKSASSSKNSFFVEPAKTTDYFADQLEENFHEFGQKLTIELGEAMSRPSSYVEMPMDTLSPRSTCSGDEISITQSSDSCEINHRHRTAKHVREEMDLAFKSNSHVSDAKSKTQTARTIGIQDTDSCIEMQADLVSRSDLNSVKSFSSVKTNRGQQKWNSIDIQDTESCVEMEADLVSQADLQSVKSSKLVNTQNGKSKKKSIDIHDTESCVEMEAALGSHSGWSCDKSFSSAQSRISQREALGNARKMSSSPKLGAYYYSPSVASSRKPVTSTIIESEAALSIENALLQAGCEDEESYCTANNDGETSLYKEVILVRKKLPQIGIKDTDSCIEIKVARSGSSVVSGIKSVSTLPPVRFDVPSVSFDVPSVNEDVPHMEQDYHTLDNTFQGDGVSNAGMTYRTTGIEEAMWKSMPCPEYGLLTPWWASEGSMVNPSQNNSTKPKMFSSPAKVEEETLDDKSDPEQQVSCREKQLQ